jgi:hypothetical protein
MASSGQLQVAGGKIAAGKRSLGNLVFTSAAASRLTLKLATQKYTHSRWAAAEFQPSLLQRLT